MPKRPVFRIGVFAPTTVQLLDLAGVDIFHMASHAYLALLTDLVPASLLALAPDVEIVYISQVPPGSLLPLTADMKIVTTHHYTDAAVAPGRLNVVYIPGPDPAMTWDADAKAWLVRQAETEGVDILSICTGIFVCGDAGLLRGRKASGPRGLQGVIKKKFDGVELVGEEYRWVKDGNLWSSGKFSFSSTTLLDAIRFSV